MPKPTSPKIRDELFKEHLPYEIWMLHETLDALNRSASDKVLENALIESFAVHARNLIEFLGGEYFDLGQFTAPKYNRGTQLDWKKATTKLNVQISHITQARTTIAAEKLSPSERAEILVALEKELGDFKSVLSPECKNLMESGPSGPPEPGATNMIGSVTGGSSQ